MNVLSKVHIVKLRPLYHWFLFLNDLLLLKLINIVRVDSLGNNFGSPVLRLFLFLKPEKLLVVDSVYLLIKLEHLRRVSIDWDGKMLKFCKPRQIR